MQHLSSNTEIGKGMYAILWRFGVGASMLTNFFCLNYFLLSFSLKDEGPTVRDLTVKFSTGKKSSKNRKKLEKALKVLKVSNYTSAVMFFCEMLTVWRLVMETFDMCF